MPLFVLDKSSVIFFLSDVNSDASAAGWPSAASASVRERNKIRHEGRSASYLNITQMRRWLLTIMTFLQALLSWELLSISIVTGLPLCLHAEALHRTGGNQTCQNPFITCGESERSEENVCLSVWYSEHLEKVLKSLGCRWFYLFMLSFFCSFSRFVYDFFRGRQRENLHLMFLCPTQINS